MCPQEKRQPVLQPRPYGSHASPTGPLPELWLRKSADSLPGLDVSWGEGKGSEPTSV